MVPAFTPDFTGRDLGGRWQVLQTRSNSVGNNLVVDSQIVPAGKHWLINSLIFQVNSPVSVFDLKKTEAGLYVCPPGTPADPLDINSRPIRLDSPLKALNQPNAPGTSFGTCISSVNPFILPQGWFLRGIIPITLTAFVQLTFGGNATFGAPNGGGNSIIVFVAAFNTGGDNSVGLHDTQGNVYSSLGFQGGASSNNFSQVWIAKNIKAGANTVTDDSRNVGVFRNTIIAEYVADAVNPVVSSNSIFQSGTGPISVSLNVRPGNLALLMPVMQGVVNVPAGFIARGNVGFITSYLFDKVITSDSNPFSVSTNDAGGGSLWGLVLQNQAFGMLNGLFIQRDNC